MTIYVCFQSDEIKTVMIWEICLEKNDFIRKKDVCLFLEEERNW